MAPFDRSQCHNYGAVLYRFRDTARYWSNILIFFVSPGRACIQIPMCRGGLLVIHPGTNRIRSRKSTLIQTNALPQSQTGKLLVCYVAEIGEWK